MRGSLCEGELVPWLAEILCPEAPSVAVSPPPSRSSPGTSVFPILGAALSPLLLAAGAVLLTGLASRVIGQRRPRSSARS